MTLQQECHLEADAPGAGWIQAYLAFVFACQLLLLVPQLSPARVLLRTGTFGVSILLAILIRPRSRLHPAWWAAMVILGILMLEIFHPTTNTFLAGLAECCLYASILAPLWWVCGIRVDEPGFRGIIQLMWLFNAVGALVGVLQVVFPGHFEPHLSSVVQAQGQGYVDSLKITLANGREIFRPMGLGDSPGGAANAGFFTVLLGGGLLVTRSRSWMRIACAISLLLGFFCLYLSQVRVLMVMTAICLIVFIGLMCLRGEGRKVAGLALVLVITIGLSLSWAIAVGGKAATQRMMSLVEASPEEVYYTNRGHFLEDTVTELLPKYPFGAGLGRWGMMYSYFGDQDSKESPMIWVEIMWTGWLLDGGVPLVAAYLIALGLAFYCTGKIALNRQRPELAIWAALVFAYNTGALAVTFNNPLFVSDGGLQFWLLNAAIWAAMVGPDTWSSGRARLRQLAAIPRKAFPLPEAAS